MATFVDVMIVVTAVLFTLRAIVHALAYWWTTSIGRHLMLEFTAFAVVVDLAAARVLFGDSTWFEDLRGIVWLLLPVVALLGLSLQLRAHRRNRRD